MAPGSSLESRAAFIFPQVRLPVLLEHADSRQQLRHVPDAVAVESSGKHSGMGPVSLPLAASFVFGAVAHSRKNRSHRRRTRGFAAATETESAEVHSPFEDSEESKLEEGKEPEKEKENKPTLPLTWDNVETVLDELRPYLRSDGGDCKIKDIDGPIVKLELQGACSSCSASSVTLKMGIEKTLMERIPEIREVVGVTPDQEPLSDEGIEEVLEGIRPFLNVSGGSIDVEKLEKGEKPVVTLKMIGPPLKSMAVRVEVMNRIKRKYPHVTEVLIVGEDGKPPPSA